MFSPLQVLLVTLLMAFYTWQRYNLQVLAYAPTVFIGMVVGLIMGDFNTGLLIGGQMCLMSLGIGGYGGSSVPDYAMGTAAGAAFAIGMQQTGATAIATALAVGVPVAALAVQLDVLGKMSGSFFIHKMMASSKEKDWKKMGIWFWSSQIPFCLIVTLPVFLLMTVGAPYVETIVNNFPVWLSNGLKVASGMLPALGFAILLKYLPMKKYGYFLILGFTLAAYLNLDILAIALLGIVLCTYIYKTKEDQERSTVSVTDEEYDDE